MDSLEAVVAVYDDWGIGAEGTQPLTLRADRLRFRHLTEGAAILVGSRTLADFPGGRPLKNRVNIVLSRRSPEIPGAVVVESVAEALAEAERHPRTLVVGGARVYAALLPYVSRVHVTRIEALPRSDVFFPDLDALPEWEREPEEETGEEDGVHYRFLTYRRGGGWLVGGADAGNLIQ